MYVKVGKLFNSFFLFGRTFRRVVQTVVESNTGSLVFLDIWSVVSDRVSRLTMGKKELEGFTITSALNLLCVSQKAYKTLNDAEFKEVFHKKIKVETLKREAAEKANALAEKNSKKRSKSKSRVIGVLPLIDTKKMIEKNMRMHEGYQYLVKRRAQKELRQQRFGIQSFFCQLILHRILNYFPFLCISRSVNAIN